MASVDVNKNPVNILGQLIGSNMGRLQAEEGEKVLRNLLRTKAQELVNQPGGQDILAAHVIPSDEDTARIQQTAQSQQAIQPTEQPQIEQNQEKRPNIGKRVLRGLGAVVGGFLEGVGQPAQLADNQIAESKLRQQRMQQEISGTVPLQQGEKDRIRLERAFDIDKTRLKNFLDIEKTNKTQMRDFFSKILNPEPLSAASQKSLNFVDTSLGALEEINRIFEQDPGSLLNLNVPGNPLGQQLSFLQNTFLNSKLREESGAAITEQDVNFVKNLAVKIGAGKITEADETTSFKLQTLISNLRRQKNRIIPKDKLRRFIQSEVRLGTPREEIFQFLQSKGEI